jgi:hypothetical protein
LISSIRERGEALLDGRMPNNKYREKGGDFYFLNKKPSL